MGDLNSIQHDIALEMLGDLADVSGAFTGSRVVTGAYDPENPTSGTTETYSGTGIFGLQFTKEDSQIFQIEQNDQKAIIMKVNSSGTPQVGDMMNGFKIIHIVAIPADNGWTLQLRKV